MYESLESSQLLLLRSERKYTKRKIERYCSSHYSKEILRVFIAYPGIRKNRILRNRILTIIQPT